MNMREWKDVLTERHHIVFKSQGGLDFDLNLIELTIEEHKGDKGPHKSRERDIELKLGLQSILFEMFPRDKEFSLSEISEKIGVTKRYLSKPFRKVPAVHHGRAAEDGYKGEDIVKRLMGGRFY